MTMTRPWRRITLHLSQIFLTLGWTFIDVSPGSYGRSREAADAPSQVEMVRIEMVRLAHA
jgi:hypothetical protein